ncbi:MAG: HAMP domain-containing histidine kinase [Kitasatospora sp.]|jgi:signal transduction histidine kinase|nr:HAMP domain-containing histidine kinase [Kitasatospora sp.]
MSVQALLASKPRLPRHTVRLRLTLLYGGLFFASGTGLVIITYVLVAHRLPPFVTVHRSPQAGTGTSIGPGAVIGGPGAAACAPDRPGPVTPEQLAQCAQQAKETLARQRAAELNQLLTTSGIALAVMTVISIGFGWLVAGRVLRPLRTITTAARRLSASSLHQRLALGGPDDELKELGDTFDALLARLEASFAAQRQFVANASHELRTPLARQRAVAEVALADPERTVASLSHACRRVLAAGEQQERLIEALLTLARSQRGLGRREPVDLAAITDDAMRSRLAEAGRRGLAVRADLGPAAALGDVPLAERLAANLLDNAVAHNTPGGWVRVRTGSRDGHAVLSVANSGPVIAPAQLGRLFEPFQRLGADRTGDDGLGLGLSIVRAIADAHQATLRARALPAGGLDIQIRFPALPTADLPVTEPPRRQAVAAGTR